MKSSKMPHPPYFDCEEDPYEKIMLFTRFSDTPFVRL